MMQQQDEAAARIEAKKQSVSTVDAKKSRARRCAKFEACEGFGA